MCRTNARRRRGGWRVVGVAVAALFALWAGAAAGQAPARPAHEAAPGAPASAPAPAGKPGEPTFAPAADPSAAGGQLEAITDPGEGGSKLAEVTTAGKLRRPERALVGLEVAGGVAIPFTNYLDFGSGTDSYYMENGLGGALAVSLTLDNVELRWSYSSLGTGRVRARIPDEAIEGLRLIDQQTGGTGQIEQNIDKEVAEALVIHAVSLGYRLTFEPTSRLRLVVPLGVAIVAAQPPSFGLLSYSLYGFGMHAGFRGELLVAGLVALGLDTRFSIYVTEPDPNLGAAGYAATQNAFDAVVAWLPMLTVALHARVYY